MNKMLRTVLILLIAVAAVACAVHFTHLEAVMRRLHGG